MRMDSVFQDTDRCPKGHHSHEDDESGRCIPNSPPCDPGYVINPHFPECGKKERICAEPPVVVCGGKGGRDSDGAVAEMTMMTIRT